MGEDGAEWVSFESLVMGLERVQGGLREGEDLTGGWLACLIQHTDVQYMYML